MVSKMKNFLAILTLLTLSVTYQTLARECRTTVLARDYDGTQAWTAEGIPCQSWSVQNDPHSIHAYSDWRFPGSSRINSQNYCRNPDNEAGGPWCYTIDPEVRWQNCDVPFCNGVVDEVEPQYIGTGGGVRITIHGAGFATNQFNFGSDSHVGNRVWLASDYEQLECEVHKDGSTENMIEFFAPEGLYDAQWRVKLTVDGVETPDAAMCNGNPNSWSCSVRPAPWITPYISMIWPVSGPPDSIITVRGKIITDLFGSNAAAASNGNVQQLLRVYVGGQSCSLKKDADEFYGLALDNSRSENGNIICKIESSYVTNSMVSFLVQAPYGRSERLPDTYQVSGQQVLYNFQSYAVVDSLSHSSGSTMGGQLLTITGNFFDETKSPAEVTLGGEACEVVEVTDSTIICRTPAEPTVADWESNPNNTKFYPGGRGMKIQYFNSSFAHLAIDSNRDTLLARTDFAEELWYDQGYFCEGSGRTECTDKFDTDINNFNIKGQSFFVPPVTGQYRFKIKGDDQVRLYFSETGGDSEAEEIAYFDRNTGSRFDQYDTQTSRIFDLEAGKSYYMKFIFSEYGSFSHYTLAVEFLDTHLVTDTYEDDKSIWSPSTAWSHNGVVNPETQYITITGENNAEAQRMTLDVPAVGTSTKEVQTVTMVSDDADSTWRLGMHGAWTDILNVDTTDIVLERILNDLPTIYPERVSVTATTVTTSTFGRTFVITFDSELGNWPLFSKSSSGSTVTVAETTSGVASLSEWRLLMEKDGSVLFSDPITSVTPTPEQVETAVDSMFTARCPRSIGAPSRSSYYFFQDYEVSGSAGFFNGIQDKESEPFCGQASNLNPYRIYDNSGGFGDVDVNFYKWMCFAYRGGLRNDLYIHWRSSTRSFTWSTFDVELNRDGEWHYTCINIEDVLSEIAPTESNFLFKEFDVKREGIEDIWIDELYIGGVPTTLFTEDSEVLSRRIPLPARLSDVRVELNASAGYYDITFRPFDCIYSFEMLRIFNAPRSSGSFGTSSSNVVYSGTGMPASSSATFERLSAASAPVTGTFELTYNTETRDSIPADVTGRNLESYIRDMGLENVKVGHTDDSCYGSTFSITFTGDAGNVDVFEVNGDNLVSDGATEDVTIAVTEVDGHVLYSPIPGDLLRTVETTKQLHVKINGISSRCDGDCSYAWEAPASEPTITGVTPDSASLGDTVTITGTNFDTSAGNNYVMIGSSVCTPTTASATEIECTLGSGARGNFTVQVAINSVGWATGMQYLVIEPVITAVEPEEAGSTAGGASLTFIGSGFDDSTTVTIDGNDCTITMQDATNVVCTTPAGDAGDVALVVTVDGTAVTAPRNYTYADAPVCDSFSPTVANVAGGGELTILGSNFGEGEDLSVYLESSDGQKHNVVLNMDAVTDSYIEGNLPSVPAGDYTLHASVGTFGLCTFVGDNNTISIPLQVHDMVSTEGSMEGGTTVVIDGVGFGSDKDEVEVKFTQSNEAPLADRVAGCMIDEITDSQIVCQTEPGSVTHVVYNGASDARYGLGYAWKPAVSYIMAGDRVRFQWTSPPFVTSINYKVQQTLTIDGEYDGTGFSSGETGSNNGHFTHQFLDVGTYYFSSGYVDAAGTIEMRGRVVVHDKSSFLGNLTVTVGGHMAANDNPDNVEATLPSGTCEATVVDIDGCTDDSNLTTDAYQFKFATCKTPEVTAQDITSGYIDSNITFTGTGFNTTACRNEISIGEYTCPTTSEAADEVVCNMDASETPDVGIRYPVSVRVHNLGKALWSAENSSFTLYPSMTMVSPSSGSLNGGTNITITGAGFVGGEEGVTVRIGAIGPLCNVQMVSYTEIVCVTTASSEMSDLLQIIVTNQLDAEVPVQNTTSDCIFSYSADATPTVTDIFSPDRIMGESSDLVINGTSFGTSSADVSVMLDDGSECVVSSIQDDAIECSVGRAKAGTRKVMVEVAGKGLANTVTIHSVPAADTIEPVDGSIYGGQVVTITGTGFHDVNNEIIIAGVMCEVTSASITQVVCTTGALGAESINADVDITSSGVSFDTLYYNYSLTHTPDVTAVDPVGGGGGDELTITGTGFSTTPSDNYVSIGGVQCTVNNASATEIVCVLGSNAAGVYNVSVSVGGLGMAEKDVEFEYQVTASAVSPNSGSFGGNQELTISGGGFMSSTTVSICGEWAGVGAFTDSQITVSSPLMDSGFGNGDLVCDVVLHDGDQSVTLTDAFTYTEDETAEITDVSPRRGGTMGGTRITVTGTKFGASNNNVTIYGSTCDIITESETEIVCETNPPGASVKTNVVVINGNLGESIKANSDYWFVDVWSSNFTWGGFAPPTAGDLVVVPHGQLLLLDQETPVLKMLLIQGGELLFDEVDLTLRAENILIVSGGRLTVGTEDAPFQHDATIEMHGQLRAQELPIYGAKCLAIREGELNLHGKPIRMTWTKLGATANAGDDEIVLEYGQADWPVGSKIVIATTGHRHSQGETETRIITAVSADGMTLTLDSALEYEHLGETVDLGGGHAIEMRAEVGLLSRNVRVIGTRDQQWADDIEACPEGFDTGEFATQTCFQGRFGDEVGSDQFGAQIMFHAPIKDSQLARGKLSYIEVNYAGQAFKLGRYPVHFHLNGDMSGSYVRGLAIHETFNRAINIHGTHNVLVEHTVAYDVMGGALFLEDGIETGNMYMYNLVLLVKASSSLLNDDVTPAAFWATNPNNTYIGNHAAGGTHFGWWYRMKEHPEGPSFTSDYCPRHVPLATVRNNTVHSQGWFGLWTFQDYYPMVGGGCSGTVPEPAVFDSYTVWNCEKGLEFVNGGSLQFPNSLLVNNERAGLEGKLTKKLGTEAPYTDRGPLIRDSVIVADVGNVSPFQHGDALSRSGVILPWTDGFSLHNITFIGFDADVEQAVMMTSIDGTCSVYCGGYKYQFSNISFVGGDQRIGKFRWAHDGIFHDLDGSLTGSDANVKVVPWTDSLDPDKCTIDQRFSLDYNGAICDADTDFARFSFNNPNMASMLYKDVVMVTEHGQQKAPWTDKKLTHPDGWTFIVEVGKTYKMYWENQEHITNLTYSSAFSGLNGGVVIKHNITRKPDRFGFSSSGVQDIDAARASTPNPEQDVHGDFYYNENDNEISFLVSNKKSRTKRNADTGYVIDRVNPTMYRCFWPNCEPPPDQNSLPPIAERPPGWMYWSNTSAWESGVLPQADEDVIIAPGKWIVADIPFPKLRRLTLRGNLEFDGDQQQDGSYKTFSLEVEHLVIMGGRLVVGWEENRFRGDAEIILNGDQYTEPYPQENGASIGVKAIASYGGLDLHGIQRAPVMAKLAATVAAGADSITVDRDIDWQVGEEIAITTTAIDPRQTEVRTIATVSDRTLTLTSPLTYRHVGEVVELETDNAPNLYVQAEVALLTRNVRVKGGDHSNLERLGLGGRILVSQFLYKENADDVGTALTGWARISYTQFIQMGQLGYSEPFDPRHAVAYVQTGPVSSVKPSYLRGNAFTTGFSPAIGVYGAESIRVQDNTMHRTIGGSLIVHGDNHIIERNLATSDIFPGHYNGRYEAKSMEYNACFTLQKSGTITVKDNIAAGCERYGYRVHGEPCDGSTEAWSGNVAHSCMAGVATWIEDVKSSDDCVKIEGFTAWRNFDYGIWFQSRTNPVFANNILFENKVSIWHLIIGPDPLSHVLADKFSTVENCYIAGATDSFDCVADGYSDDTNLVLSPFHRSWYIQRGGFSGVSGVNCDRSSNNYPFKPFAGRMSYPTIKCRLDIKDTVFAHFGSRTCGESTYNDFMFSINPASDDIQHPTYVSGITVEPTALKGNMFFYQRSNVARVNPSDCVDMDCDGHKKTLVMDMDGSMLGSKGVVVDDAAYEWDGDARYGLGDYRIPKVALTFPNNSRFDPPTLKGIARPDGCTWMSSWRAWECLGDDLKYDMLVIDSMDADNEVRRLSPIAVFSDNGYIDLLNGPQDHGWCAGYTCQLRASIFWTPVMMGHEYKIYLTSTNPQRTRFLLLRSDPTDAVRIAIYYHSPQRLDVFSNDNYISPKNAEIQSDGNYNLLPEETPGQYIPALTDNSGANYFDRDWQIQYIIVKGGDVYEIIIKQVVIVSLDLPPMTIDDFFGENIVANLAAFLNIPANKIRIVNVVRETSSRKRQTNGVSVDIEIGDPPSTESTADTANEGDLDLASLVNITRQVVDAVQLGTLGSELNLTIIGVGVQEPLPQPENSTDSEWATLSSTLTNETAIASIQIPTDLMYDIEAVSQREMQPFPTQPVFSMFDAAGELVEILGSRADPWKMKATLVGRTNAYLIGDTCGFSNGYCRFENLTISHAGAGYTIRFQLSLDGFTVSDPATASFSTFDADGLDVTAAELTPGFPDVPVLDVAEAEMFNVTVDIRDMTTSFVIPEIDWKGHTWTATLSIHNPAMTTGGTLSGTLTQTFDPATGLAVFTDLTIDIAGKYALFATVMSTPNDYEITGRSAVVTIAPNVTTQNRDYSYKVETKFLASYSTNAAGNEDLVAATWYNYLLSIDNSANYHDFAISEGSIVVAYWVSGEPDAVQAVLTQIASDLTNGLILTMPAGTLTADAYMKVDDTFYSDALQGSVNSQTTPATTGMSSQVAMIAGIVVGSIVFLTIIIVVVALVLKKNATKNKTSHDDSEFGSQHVHANNPSVHSHSPLPDNQGQMSSAAN